MLCPTSPPTMAAARHPSGRIAGGDGRVASAPPDQPADMDAARHPSGRIAGGDGAVALPDQPADPDPRPVTSTSTTPTLRMTPEGPIEAEQADPVRRGPFDEQAGDGVAIALKGRAERPDGLPAGAAVPVRVVRVNPAVAVDVKVQVQVQFIARAAAAGAAGQSPVRRGSVFKRGKIRRLPG